MVGQGWPKFVPLKTDPYKTWLFYTQHKAQKCLHGAGFLPKLYSISIDEEYSR